MDDLHTVGTIAMVGNEAKVGRDGATPLSFGEEVLSVVVRVTT